MEAMFPAPNASEGDTNRHRTTTTVDSKKSEEDDVEDICRAQERMVGVLFRFVFFVWRTEGVVWKIVYLNTSSRDSDGCYYYESGLESS